MQVLSSLKTAKKTTPRLSNCQPKRQSVRYLQEQPPL